MSFGFGIGDFITVIKLVDKIRQEFAEAPGEFEAISDEVESLSVVLRKVENAWSNHNLDDNQKTELWNISSSCRSVLNDLEKVLDDYSDLDVKSEGVVQKGKRVWKRLKWKPTNIRDFRNRIISNVTLLNTFNQQIAGDSVFQLVRIQYDQENQTILDWLTPFDYGPQQSDYISRRQPGTGLWFIESPEYQAWLGSKGRTLFCPGITGAGKTILTSIVVNDLFARFQNDIGIGIAYLYCNFKRKDEQRATDLILSLIKQLCQGRLSLPSSVRNLYNHHIRQRTRPSADEISMVLKSISATYSKVYIIIDALDECQTSDGCRDTLLSEVFDLQKQETVNILATSRFIPDISDWFTGSMSLDIHATKDDVRMYLENHMNLLPQFVRRNSTMQKEIASTISNAADGMFLLAQIYFRSLQGKSSIGVIKDALSGFLNQEQCLDEDQRVSVLTDAYEKAMETIVAQQPDIKSLAIQVLAWITCARSQLSILELQNALAVKFGSEEFNEDYLPDIEVMMSACAGLVTTDKKSGIIRLVHYTTQEYLEKTQGHWFPEAHLAITRVCTTYLSYPKFAGGYCKTRKKFDQRLQLNPLYQYAADNWGYHARFISDYEGILSFLGKKGQVEASVQALPEIGVSWYCPDRIGTTGLHLASFFGLSEIMNIIIDDYNVDVVNEGGQTPLHWAAKSGNANEALLLLEKGANIETKSAIKMLTPLHTAVSHGSRIILKPLLMEGANIEAKNVLGRTPLSTAVHHNSEHIVQLLLEEGADIESRSKYGLTPLSEAVYDGRESMVQLLLKAGADIEARVNNSWTSSKKTANNNRLALEDGKNIETKYKYHSPTPLCIAVKKRNTTMVQLLLQGGANVEAMEKYTNRTPLWMAVEGNNTDITQLLLRQGANIEAEERTTGKTPIFSAIRIWSDDMVQLLLIGGANTEARDEFGQTPLFYAVAQDKPSLVLLLLKGGADIEAQNNSSWTSIWIAVKDKNEAMVQSLLGNGANIEAKDKHTNQTPLWMAVKDDSETMVQLLLKWGANIEAKDGDSGWTPLLWAVWNRSEAMVRLLLKEGAYIEAKQEDNGWTPLFVAVYEESEEMVRILLDNGACMDITDRRDGTTLLSEAEKGPDAILQLLLEKREG